MDRVDPLAGRRGDFVVARPERIYLDGNSLGMTPRRTVDALRHVVEHEWAHDLIDAWWDDGWLELPLTVGDELAPVIGARPGEVAVHDSTTVCLFQLVNVALDLHPDPDPDPDRDRRVVAVSDTEFPTDRHVVDGIARLRRDVEVRRGLDDLDGVDVAVRSLVDYRTAELVAMADEEERAAEAGATIVWDLSHAAGVVAVDLTGDGAVLAAGCTYKFLNGGPGSPAFTYVRREIHEAATQPIWGWFGQDRQFAMDRSFDPRAGAGRMLNGTPEVLGLTAARSGISLTNEVGIDAITAKARSLSGYAIELAGRLGLPCPTRPWPATSGGHVSIVHPESKRLQLELAERGVVVDERDPDVLRLGLSPLTTRFVDVHDALHHLADLVSPS
ncbi:kynureninase [Ilumatobacter sp.]|uniref:kynureninase/PvdN C-terminal domain-containing protein n=1 Tax=Ilumatobacter sp. TaxID=1967498 RepID=UPI003B518301